MKHTILYGLILMCQLVFGQDGFKLNHPKQTIIPFEFINNQIILDIFVNSTPLKFILDTGVDETIIFSLDNKNELIINNPTQIKFKGLGSNKPIEGIKTEKNKVSIGKKYGDLEHTLYIIVDQDIDLTSTIGFPINGIIGYQFFKNYPIAIDYTSKKIIVYQENAKKLIKKKLKYGELPIQILRNKPFVETQIIVDETPEKGRFLLDTGNSDYVWLFNLDFHKRTQEKKIHDFLGKGFSGDVYGHKFRVKKAIVLKQTFINPIMTTPDETSIQNIHYVENRKGSLGSGFISRYDVIFDYKNHMFYTLKTKRLKQPFLYNRSGVEVVLGGTFLSSEKVSLNTATVSYGSQSGSKNASLDINALNSKMVEKPIYSIQNVRDYSQAKKLGITKGDIIESINGQEAKDMKLQDIIEILQSKNTTIRLKLNRKNKIIKVDLPLEDIL